jgi:large subunit ribosomal protein L14
MIYPESKLGVSDNSGAKLVKCIKVLNFSKSSGAKPADLVVISIRKIKANKNIIKGQICRGVLIRGKRNIQRMTGLSIKFNDNALVLVDKKSLPLASRIAGIIYRELRLKDYPKVLALAKTAI